MKYLFLLAAIIAEIWAALAITLMAIIGTIFFKETITIVQILGIVLIIGGVLALEIGK